MCAAAALLFASCGLRAQYIKYPESVKEAFAKADAQASPSSVARPMIGVTDPSLASSVVAAGGVPVMVFSDINDFNVLRDLAAGLDGFILSEDMKKPGESGILLLKAIVDRNVPVLGSSPLFKSICDGVMRLPSDFSTVEGLVHKAATYKQAKAIMGRCLTVDTHCDLPCEYDDGASIGRRFTNQVSVQKMTEGSLDAQFVVAYLRQGPVDVASSAAAVRKCDRILTELQDDVARVSDYCGIARTPAEAYALRDQGKKAIFVAIENGYGIGNDISNIARYAERGVTYMTLCHTRDNAICHTSSTYSEDTSKGLTPFGFKVVEELNRTGIVVDVSHASVGTFWDVYRTSKVPFVCSHSGAYAVYPHNRSLDDRQLRAIAEKNGVIQVFMVPDFMAVSSKVPKVSIKDYMDHMMHCIEVAGIDHVGIGADFDGGGGGWGINGDNDIVNITVELLERGFSEPDIRKILGENMMRVVSEVQAHARNLTK